MAKERIRVGIIGAGTFAEECHIPGIQAHPQAEVVALCARNPQRLQRVSARFGIQNMYNDYHKLLAQPDIDAVTISLPDALHFPAVIAALEAGKHVFCEKPLANTTDEAQKMTDAAQRSGLVAMVSFTFRYTRALQALRNLLQTNALGTPFAVSMQVHWGGFGYPQTALTWREQATGSAAGIWGDGASHLFDALAYVLAPVQEVCAQMMIVPRTEGTPQPDSIDIATCLAHVQLPENQQRPATEALAYADRSPGTVHVTIQTSRVDGGPGEIQVLGTNGAAKISLTRGAHEQYSLVGQDGNWQPAQLSGDAYTDQPLALTRMMGAFIEATLKGQLAPDDPDFSAGLYAQRALEAAIRSSQEKRWVRV